MINVKYVDMEPKVRGCVAKNEDGSYTILLNSRCGRLAQEKAYLHELEHINKEDFDSDEPITEIEARRH